MSREQELKARLQSGSLKAIIFDFDGTILDIREILEKSIEEILIEKNINVDMETTIQEIGALLETIQGYPCLLYTSPSPRDRQRSRMPSSA